MFEKMIINADDFGLTSGVNRGIIECSKAGVVTSTTLLVNSRAAVEAALLAGKNPELGVGLHLNLTSGVPVLPADRVPSLVTGDKVFRGRLHLLTGISLGRVRSNELAAEVGAQIDRCRELGVEPTHVDSHHHIHAHPLLRRRIEEVCVGRGIRKIRTYHTLLGEGSLYGFSDNSPEAIRDFFGAFLLAACELMAPGKLEGPTELLGFPGIGTETNNLFSYLTDRQRRERHMRKMRRRISVMIASMARPKAAAGTLEIMCHPGYCDADLEAASRYSRQREEELRLLLSPEVKKALDTSGARLVSFRDL